MRIGEVVETSPNGGEIRRAVMTREKGKPVVYFVWVVNNPRVQKFDFLLAAQMAVGTVTLGQKHT